MLHFAGPEELHPGMASTATAALPNSSGILGPGDFRATWGAMLQHTPEPTRTHYSVGFP